MKHLFKQRNFLALWLGQLISSYGDRLNQMACVALISSMLPGSTKAIAYLFTASQLSVVFVGPVSGVYVDRWNPKKCMILCDVFRSALVLLIPAAMFLWPADAGGWMIFLSVIVFMVGALTRVFVPARLSLMPDVLERNSLLSANAILAGSILLASVLGLASGDIILGLIGCRNGFAVDSLTFLVSAFFILLISTRKAGVASGHEPDDKREEPVPHFFRELLEGLHLLVTHRSIFFAVTSLCMLMGGAGAIFVLITVYIKTGFNELFAGGAYGVFLGTFGLGAILGAFLLSLYGQNTPREKLLSLGFLLTGILALPFSWLLVDGFQKGTLMSFLKMNSLALIIGISVAPVAVTCDTWLQEVVPEKIRGRIFAAKETLLSGSFIIGNLLIGWLAEGMAFKQRNLLLFLTAGFLTVVGIMWSALLHQKGSISDQAEAG